MDRTVILAYRRSMHVGLLGSPIKPAVQGGQIFIFGRKMEGAKPEMKRGCETAIHCLFSDNNFPNNRSKLSQLNTLVIACTRRPARIVFERF